MESRLGLSILSGFSPYAQLQVVTQSTPLIKDCYPLFYYYSSMLVTNPHRSEIRASRLMSFHFFFLRKTKKRVHYTFKNSYILGKGHKSK